MPIDDTYNWNQLSPATVPDPRRGHAMVWDGSRIIMFGGQKESAGSIVDTDETWEFNGTNWNLLSPATSPPARGFHSMAWDGTRAVMYGGRKLTGPPFSMDDTWEFDGTDWTDLSPANTPKDTDTGPVELIAYPWAMVWDDANSRFVLTKYTDNQSGGFLIATPNETWAFTAGNWTQLSPSTDGPYPVFARQFYGVAMVVHDGIIITQGGRISTNAVTDHTSEFDGSAWADLSPATTPGDKRADSQLVYDGSRSLLFGGNLEGISGNPDPVNDNWLWNGTNWEFFNPTDKPGARYYHQMIWDGNRMLMFGGHDWTGSGSSAAHLLDDTWELATTAETPTAGHAISHTFGLGD